MKRMLCVSSALVLTMVTAACGAPPVGIGVPDKRPTRHTIVFYGFSVQEEVMTEEIFPAFAARWRDQTDEEVTFRSVFTSSEQISAAIIKGAPADVAVLANEQHAVWLRITDSIETDWRTFPHQGMISRSPIVIVVRPGNPLDISTWDDLADTGVRLVHAHPATSGGAQWALLAEYGASMLRPGGSKEAAREQLQRIWANVVVTPPSSREALRQFIFGTGDALVTYEQDALLAQSRGAALEVIVPPRTFVSEHPVVIVDANVTPYQRDVVEAFAAFLWSDAAQRAFTRYYFRAVTDEALNDAVPEFPRLDQSFTVQDLGGRERAYPDIIEGIWAEELAEP